MNSTEPEFKSECDIASGDELFISSVSDFSKIEGWFLSLDGRTQVTLMCMSCSLLSGDFFQITLVDFKYWEKYPTAEQMKEAERHCLYPPRFKVVCKQNNPSKPLQFSLKVSKNNKEDAFGSFPLINETTGR